MESTYCLFFLLGVGVVKAHVANAAVVARQAEVQADAFGGPRAGCRWVPGGKRVRILAGRAGGVGKAASPGRRPLALGVGAGGEVFSMTWRRKFDVLSAWPHSRFLRGAWWCRDDAGARDGGACSHSKEMEAPR